MEGIDTLQDKFPLLYNGDQRKKEKMAKLREEDLDFLAQHTDSDRCAGFFFLKGQV